MYNLTSPHVSPLGLSSSAWGGAWSPRGSPRSGGGYNAIAMSGGGGYLGGYTPNTAATPGMPLPVFSIEGEGMREEGSRREDLQRERERHARDKELEAAESAVIDSLVD